LLYTVFWRIAARRRHRAGAEPKLIKLKTTNNLTNQGL
jgi:hypothetical protein